MFSGFLWFPLLRDLDSAALTCQRWETFSFNRGRTWGASPTQDEAHLRSSSLCHVRHINRMENLLSFQNKRADSTFPVWFRAELLVDETTAMAGLCTHAFPYVTSCQCHLYLLCSFMKPWSARFPSPGGLLSHDKHESGLCLSAISRTCNLCYPAAAQTCMEPEVFSFFHWSSI